MKKQTHRAKQKQNTKAIGWPMRLDDDVMGARAKQQLHSGWGIYETENWAEIERKSKQVSSANWVKLNWIAVPGQKKSVPKNTEIKKIRILN